ncbi:MAG: ubiquinol-cytochrome c reductase iron-sulfur subunit [Terriglobia bacterium]
MANVSDPATPAPAQAAVPAVATPVKAAPKAASTKAKTAVEEISPSAKLRRRIIWSCVWGFVAANLLMFLRFFFPRALFEPSTVFKIGYPSDFQPGVDERFKAADRIWVVREADRIFVIFGRCTHLGCTPDWKPAEHKFKCPCHGSGYTPEGINFEGPAPRPMDRAHLELDATGQIIVDTSRLYSWPKGGVDHFSDPGSFVNV